MRITGSNESVGNTPDLEGRFQDIYNRNMAIRGGNEFKDLGAELKTESRDAIAIIRAEERSARFEGDNKNGRERVTNETFAQAEDMLGDIEDALKDTNGISNWERNTLSRAFQDVLSVMRAGRDSAAFPSGNGLSDETKALGREIENRMSGIQTLLEETYVTGNENNLNWPMESILTIKRNMD